MPFLIALIFAALGALHLYWAAGGRPPGDAVLPQLEGRPLFVPGRGATALVGLLLWRVAWRCRGPREAAGRCRHMALRAVGDFRYVGFFKRVRNGRFAALDTMYYSPLCLALAAGIGWTAFTALN